MQKQSNIFFDWLNKQTWVSSGTGLQKNIVEIQQIIQKFKICSANAESKNLYLFVFTKVVNLRIERWVKVCGAFYAPQVWHIFG